MFRFQGRKSRGRSISELTDEELDTTIVNAEAFLEKQRALDKDDPRRSPGAANGAFLAKRSASNERVNRAS